jgi:hypothetical protein
MASHYLRKYATATTVDFELYKLDGTGLKSDAASATHDIKIMKDEGAEADTTADAFTDEGQGYSLALTDTEMTAARVVIYIVDQTSPQAWLDKVLIIETYGNASAQHRDVLDVQTEVNKIGTITNTNGTATIGAVLGDAANSSLVTRIGAGAAQAASYTSTRAGYLDNINNANLANIVVSSSKVNCQVKGQDDIDFGATQKSSITAAVPSVANILAGAVDGTTTVKQVLAIDHAVLAGKSTGGGTSTLTFRDVGDSKARVTATVDADGNRTAISTDGA